MRAANGWVGLLGMAFCGAVALQVSAQGVWEDAVLKYIDFKKVPLSSTSAYGGGKVEAYCSGRGGCMLTMELPDWDYQMVWGAKLATDEVMGVAGGVYRARCGREAATFERIAEPDLPKGVIVPAWNSGTIPLRGMMRFANSTKRGGFIGTEFKAAKITGKEPKDAKAELELDYRPDGFPQKASVTVKAGDYVLIDEKGHLIRAIAPPNKETRVVGWIEIASERVPEANLVRDKKSIVRPRFEGDKK